MPVNTDNSIRLAVKNLSGMGRKLVCTGPWRIGACLFIECHDAATVSKCLCMFVLETQKADGT